MTNFRTKLIGHKQVAKDTMAFVFEKPKNFTYKPGQYISITLTESHPGSTEAGTHYFSLASDPRKLYCLVRFFYLFREMLWNIKIITKFWV